MEQKTDRLYPSEPLENIDLEQRLETKINDVNSFNHSINNNREMITYFKDKNNKSENKYKKQKTLTTILKSFDTFVIIATNCQIIYFIISDICKFNIIYTFIFKFLKIIMTIFKTIINYRIHFSNEWVIKFILFCNI